MTAERKCQPAFQFAWWLATLPCGNQTVWVCWTAFIPAPACAWGIWAHWSCWTWVEMHLKNCLPVFLMDWTCQSSTWVTTSWARSMLRSSTWRTSLLWTYVETAWLTPRGRTWHASRWSSMWIEVLCSWKLMEIAFATWGWLWWSQVFSSPRRCWSCY